MFEYFVIYEKNNATFKRLRLMFKYLQLMKYQTAFNVASFLRSCRDCVKNYILEDML